jgi:pseudouridine 5'-phosphatase
MTSERIKIPRIKAIIFDLDGTLLDTEALSDKAMWASLPPHALEQHMSGTITTTTQLPEGYCGLQLLPWDLKRQILGLRVSDWGPIVLKYARENWGMTEDQLPTVDKLGSHWEHNLNQLCDQVQACPGALVLVEKFAGFGFPMAIATSSCQSAVEKKRKNHEPLFQHLQTIVCGDHPAVKQGKPSPDIYIEAARQLGVHPNECLVFEDALTGVRSAKAAGCYVVAVPDKRFDADEKVAFTSEAHVVLPDLWHFSGEQFGVDIDLRPLNMN